MWKLANQDLRIKDRNNNADLWQRQEEEKCPLYLFDLVAEADSTDWSFS